MGNFGGSCCNSKEDNVKGRLQNLVSDFECTNFPDGNWHVCCVAHDYMYAAGINKWRADVMLALCVAKKGYPIIGLVMWIGVTIGGWDSYREHAEARGDN